MKEFELLEGQHGIKSTPVNSNSTPHAEKNTYGEVIFSNTGPQNQPHELKN